MLYDTTDQTQILRSTVDIVYLHLAIENHRAFGQFHHRTFQFDDDFADSVYVVDYFTPHLEIESLIAAFTMRCHDMIAGGGMLEKLSIKGLPVIVSPSRAHSANVRCITYNGIIIALKHINVLV